MNTTPLTIKTTQGQLKRTMGVAHVQSMHLHDWQHMMIEDRCWSSRKLHFLLQTGFGHGTRFWNRMNGQHGVKCIGHHGLCLDV